MGFNDQLESAESMQIKKLVGVGVLFGVIGAILLLPTFAATKSTAIEAESGQVSGKAQAVNGNSSASGGGYTTLNMSSSGGTVTLPSTPPNGTAVAVATGAKYGILGCSTKEPVCSFGWQESDMYDNANEYSAYSGFVQLMNINTGAVIKKLDVTQAPGAPQNANRPLSIYNPDKNEWLIAFHSGPAFGHSISLYAVRINASGEFIGSVMSLSDAPYQGWVPMGVYDTSSHHYYVQWHQESTPGELKKDIHATVISGDGVITEKNYNVNNSPDVLDEYAGVAYNSNRGEIMSVVSSTDANDCDNCTRNIYTHRMKISADGKLSKLGVHHLDSDRIVEWGISAGYNPTTDSYVITYREGGESGGRNTNSMFTVYTMVLDAEGKSKAAPVKLGETEDTYWTTGTSCSTVNNLCVSTFLENGTYVDTTSTGTTKIGPIGLTGAGRTTWTSRSAFSIPTEKFVIFGGNGYVLAKGQ